MVTSVVAAPRAMAVLLYQQAFDMTGNAYSSQKDTSGGYGNFATMYDNFTLGSSSSINNVTWVGEFFNPSSHGSISSFTVNFWANSSAQPGGLLQSFNVSGNGAETLLGTFGGIPTYAYSLNLGAAFAAMAGTQYWISIVPSVGYPPQWGWSTGTGGDSSSYQDFFGSRSKIGADMAFALNGTSSVPDGGNTAILFGGALLMLGISWRRNSRASLSS